MNSLLLNLFPHIQNGNNSRTCLRSCFEDYVWESSKSKRIETACTWPGTQKALNWYSLSGNLRASLVAQRLKRLPGMRETRVWSLGWEDPLEKEMATHSSILAWRIPWREEPGRLQPMGSQRVGHHWAASLSPSNLSFAINLCFSEALGSC